MCGRTRHRPAECGKLLKIMSRIRDNDIENEQNKKDNDIDNEQGVG